MKKLLRVIFLTVGFSSFAQKTVTEKQIFEAMDAQAEFGILSIGYFNHFKHKVNNFKIEIELQTDVTIKKEVMGKRKIFTKFLEINPLLKDLDNLM